MAFGSSITMKTALTSTGTLLFLSGCTMGLKHPDQRVESALELSDITTEIPRVEADIQQFETAPTVGRFPAGIAIVRVAKILDEENAIERLRIHPFKGYEIPYWGELFDGTPEVRSLYPIHEKSVRDIYVTLPELKNAAHVLNAGLLLTYGYDNTSADDACRVFGLVYEIPSGKLISAIQHRATFVEARIEAQKLPEDSRPVTNNDWKFYVDQVAFRQFEKNFKKCVWHLIDSDQAPEDLKSNPFEDAQPPYPRTWQ